MALAELGVTEAWTGMLVHIKVPQFMGFNSQRPRLPTMKGRLTLFTGCGRSHSQPIIPTSIHMSTMRWDCPVHYYGHWPVHGSFSVNTPRMYQWVRVQKEVQEAADKFSERQLWVYMQAHQLAQPPWRREAWTEYFTFPCLSFFTSKVNILPELASTDIKID